MGGDLLRSRRSSGVPAETLRLWCAPVGAGSGLRPGCEFGVSRWNSLSCAGRTVSFGDGNEILRKASSVFRPGGARTADPGDDHFRGLDGTEMSMGSASGLLRLSCRSPLQPIGSTNARVREPSRRSALAATAAELRPEIRRVWEENRRVRLARKAMAPSAFGKGSGWHGARGLLLTPNSPTASA